MLDDIQKSKFQVHNREFVGGLLCSMKPSLVVRVHCTHSYQHGAKADPAPATSAYVSRTLFATVRSDWECKIFRLGSKANWPSNTKYRVSNQSWVRWILTAVSVWKFVIRGACRTFSYSRFCSRFMMWIIIRSSSRHIWIDLWFKQDVGCREIEIYN